MKYLYLKRRKVVFALCIIATLLYGFDIYSKNDISFGGIDIGVVQQKIESLQVENALLSEKILNGQSFRVISEKTKEMGFIEEKSIGAIWN